MKLWTVDAFTDKPFSGNPADVILVHEFPCDEQCEKIASELSLPATGFIKHLTSNYFHIRWFTPLLEVPLCGHGTLAAAHILFKEGYGKENQLFFESLSGTLPVTQKDKSIVLNFPLYESENQYYDKESLNTLLGFKSCSHAFISHNAVIAELDDEAELREFQPNFEKIKEIEHNGLIVTTKGKEPYDFVSRVFGPRKGINEDPVTGSAHCLLVNYWQTRLQKDHFLAYQASPRGGEIHLKIVDDRVLLSGQAVTIIEGNLITVEHIDPNAKGKS